MSGIAEVLINQEYEVSGTDPSSSSVTDHLKSLGADIRHNHSAENILGKHVVVVSSAISENNVEVISMTGFSGGRTAELATVNLHVDGDNYGVIEDVHQSLMHLLGQYMRQSRMDESLIQQRNF